MLGTDVEQNIIPSELKSTNCFATRLYYRARDQHRGQQRHKQLAALILLITDVPYPLASKWLYCSNQKEFSVSCICATL